MKTKDFFKINGVSSDTFPNLLVNLPPIPPLAERKYTQFDAGGDEGVTSPDDAFNDIKYTIEFMTVDISDYTNMELYKLISEAKTLEISRLEGFYYKVKKAVLAAPTSKYDGAKVTYKINFTLAPFKYFVDNPYISVSSGDVIENRGNRYAKPIIEIGGIREVKLTINGEETKINFGEDFNTIILDSERKIAYSVYGNELIYNKVSGKYPMLATGQNLIEFTNDFSTGTFTDTTVSIRMNERCY